MNQLKRRLFGLAFLLSLMSMTVIAQPEENGNGPGNGNGNGNGYGIGNGNGQGLDNNPNFQPELVDDPDNPVIDAIPIDKGLVFLLAAGLALGAVRLAGKRNGQTPL